jgi:putative copper export protein
MTGELLNLALGANRMLGYAGYVLLAGTFMFWVLVWPEGRSDHRLVTLAAGGTALMVVSTLGAPAISILLGSHLLGYALTPVGGAAALVRLAALAAVAFFLVDLVGASITDWRLVLAVAVVAVLAGSLVASSDAVGGRWQLAKIVATYGHVLATAAWLGGLVALAAVLIPRENVQELDRLIPRFSAVARFSVITLVVTGFLHAVAITGSVRALVTSTYGLVLLIKVTVFAAMLLLGNHGRRYAARVTFRRLHTPGDIARSSGVQALAVVMGAELAIAVVILGVTTALVMVAPVP